MSQSTLSLTPEVHRYMLEHSLREPPVLAPVSLGLAGDGREARPIPAQVALTGQTLNLDFTKEQAIPIELTLEVSESGERPVSVLAIPLKNNEGYVLGVLELLNTRDPESGEPAGFDPNLQQMMESFSSLAVAALEAYTLEHGEPAVQSGRQEMLENMLNEYI